MRIHTKRTLQVALVSGGLLMVGTGSASAAEPVDPAAPASPLDQLLTTAGLHDVTDTVDGATDDLQATQPLQQAATGVDLQHPGQALDSVLPAAQRPAPATAAPATAAVLHTVPVHLFQHDLAPSAEVGGDLPEPNLNAPLGRELAATDLPALPATVPLTATPDTALDRATITPVDGPLPVLPLHGAVSTQPLDPAAGTRVTGLHTSDVSTDDQRADTPATTLPLLGGLLPSTNGVLPTQAPVLTGLSDLTRLASLTGLTKPAGSTPLTQQGPGGLAESATTLLGK
ncbi:hypothetical protein AB0M80_31015 [Amycolatopsis sp. NPDC051045]|uniref:hypothetical protein n=1 Tax=Amycolatopsis sp. NPDC051045 TaxID=3156922 RepID=UPI003427FB22